MFQFIDSQHFPYFRGGGGVKCVSRPEKAIHFLQINPDFSFHFSSLAPQALHRVHQGRFNRLKADRRKRYHYCH